MKRIFRFLSVIVICCMLINMSGMTCYASTDTIIRSTEKSNSLSYGYPEWADVYAASSIAFMGAEWSSARQAWAFNYKFAGTASANWRTGYDADLIRMACMEISCTSNQDNAAFWTSSSPQYLGSAPESTGSEPDYAAVASAVVGLAITAINNLGASYVWSVLSLLDAMKSTNDGETSRSDYLYREWMWSPDESDVGQFFWFIVDVEPNETVQISTEYYILGPGYELLETGTSYRNLEAGTAGKSSMPMNPEIMSKEERDMYGIETIGREEFASKAKELNISKRSQKEFLDSGDEEFYYAHNFVEYEVVESGNEVPEIDGNNLTEEALSKNIAYQIRRSDKIVRALSGGDVDENPENVAMREKHENRINELKELQRELEGTNFTRNRSVEGMYMEYRQIIGG